MNRVKLCVADRAPSGSFGGKRGQLMVLVAFAIAFLVGLAGLVIDIGNAWRAKLQMQTAADAAALDGANALLNGASASTAAQAAATQNGFTNGSGTTNNANTVTVTVNNPPASGPNTSNSTAVEVIISQAQPTYLISALGFGSISASARSVAEAQSNTTCIYMLASSGQSLLVNSGGSITSSCGLQVDSSSSPAAMVNGTVSAPSLGIVGGKTVNSGGSVPAATSTAVAVVSDPLGSLPTPSPSGSCTNLSPISGTYNLSVGYYCGLTANSSSTVNLVSSGTYSFNGNVILDGPSTMSGTGVTLYFKSGTFTLNSNVTLNLTAPTSGTYAGIAIFQDRSNSSTINLDSNSTMTINGAIYAPDANLTLNSNFAATVYSILVVSSLTINGTINISNNYSSLSNGSPIKMAVTVE